MIKMKIIINKCFGGFAVKYEIAEELGYGPFGAHDDGLRTCPELIKMIEEGKDVGQSYSRLVVIDISDEATDYHISEYDGLETLIYVVDGKLNFI